MHFCVMPELKGLDSGHHDYPAKKFGMFTTVDQAVVHVNSEHWLELAGPCWSLPFGWERPTFPNLSDGVFRR